MDMLLSYFVLLYIHLVSVQIPTQQHALLTGQRVLHILIAHFSFGIFLRLSSFFLHPLTIFSVTSNVLAAAQLLYALATSRTFSLRLALHFLLFVGGSMGRLGLENIFTIVSGW